MHFFSNQSPALILCRIVLAFSWIYQGAVPKIVCQSRGEIDLLGHVIPLYQWVCEAIIWIGAGEILFGLLLLVAASTWLFRFNIVALTGLLLFVLLFEPAMFTLPFNPLTLNISLIALSVIALIEMNKIKPTHSNESAPL
ncbi:MAG: DoxX-like family protein [Chlorobiaceae bacterium]